MMWLCAKWLAVKHPEKYNGDYYKSTVMDILGNWSDCDSIKNFFSLVKNIQLLRETDPLNQVIKQIAGSENQENIAKVDAAQLTKAFYVEVYYNKISIVKLLMGKVDVARLVGALNMAIYLNNTVIIRIITDKQKAI